MKAAAGERTVEPVGWESIRGAGPFGRSAPRLHRGQVEISRVGAGGIRDQTDAPHRSI